ncbi:hypothetical protein D3C72_267530 [compost metagenome]
MWEKFVKFMTGPFAGMTAVWEVIEDRMRVSAADTTTCLLVQELLETHPMATSQMQQFSGAKINKTNNQVRCHAIPLGKDLWAGVQIGIHGRDYSKIFICEDQNADIEDATLVFWDNVRIPGAWQNDIHALLTDAVAQAHELKAMVTNDRQARDQARANSAHFSGTENG